MAATTEIAIRRDLRPGDADEIAELHRRVYVPEYERNDAFLAAVRRSLVTAVARGWPLSGGAVWLALGSDGLAGSLALTDEGDGVGRVRWFVFAPELRGRGLGRRLLGELLDEARRAGLERLELETFSALAAAAHLYRAAGFRVVRERSREDWGPRITYQQYELELR